MKYTKQQLIGSYAKQHGKEYIILSGGDGNELKFRKIDTGKDYRGHNTESINRLISDQSITITSHISESPQYEIY